MKKQERVNAEVLGIACGEAPGWVLEEDEFYFAETEQLALDSCSAGTGIPKNLKINSRSEKNP